MTETKGIFNTGNYAKDVLYAEMARQDAEKEATEKAAIETKRKKKAEEKIRKQQQRDSKPIESRFDNAKRLRKQKAEIVAQERKMLKEAKRQKRREANSVPTKKQEKCCNRVHIPRIAA